MARTGRKGSKEKNSVKVNLDGVDVGGKVVPEGQYLVSVNEATLQNSKEGNDYIKLEFEVAEGVHKGYKLYHNCSLQPQALFNLKAVLLALGFEIPAKAFDLDIKELVGLECAVEVNHEVYEGKKKARITEFINPEESDDDEEGEIEALLVDLSKEELLELAAKLGLKKAKKMKKEEDIIELIMEEDEDTVTEAYEELFGDDEESDDEDDSDEDDDDEDEDDVDYDEMSEADLKAECKNRGIKVKKGMKKKDLIELLEEDDEE